MRRLLIALLWGATLLAVPAVPAGADDGTLFTLWPLADYRSSPATDYAALHLLGPLVKWERKGEERELALRPFLYYAGDGERSAVDLLFPLVRGASGGGFSALSSIGLLEGEERTPAVGGGWTFMLFPFLFYDRQVDRETSLAVFPLGGRLVNRFGRDEIRFALFPLYGQTRKAATRTTNLLWPFFATIDGPGESGFKAWPLFGASAREGVYRKRFALWPLFFAEDLGLDTPNPRRLRAFYPFYSVDEAPARTERVVLWPLFSYRDDREKGYKEWNFPWPFLGISRGRDHHGYRFLPLFSDEVRGDLRRRWFLWPLYKETELRSGVMERRQHQLLYFLYRDFSESFTAEEGIRRRRVALWPLFHYRRERGVSRLDLPALVDPIFPESDGVERNWAPLWRIYQAKWDGHGNRVDSLLWNLFWQERRPAARAMELFPLFFYSREGDDRQRWTLLKGLLGYRRDGAERQLRLLYLPWDLPRREDQAPTGK